MIKKIVTVVLVLVIVTSAAPVIEKLYFGIDELSSDAVNRNPELGDHFEGDMVLSLDQMRNINRAKTERNGVRSTSLRWPNRTVVYHIVEEDFFELQKMMIEDALADISNKSCIKFRVRENNEHAVLIQGSEPGCFSTVGYKGNKQNESEEDENRQVLNLEIRCFEHGTIVHEMLHTIGFYHMQSTYDRDDFVEIVWENIRAGREHNFAKYTIDTITDFDVSYDYESVMHYPTTAFSKNGNKTIVPLQENVKIGQRKGMSERDIIKLNKMYCEESEPASSESKGESS